ncbi:DUF4062 domain-containing protein [Pseudomonas rhodesiae]|jgi:hypothetical protein|uniref:hypothetical protein n=1 Tax=Pseudomonas rhodesiae TaxID=76760 RepID=UPI0014758937|nr:hypothetical protein [Pseudomonas rhodesiae]NMY77973.1 DUF4062 domain-containing protein [Pseudomonas rhodesiae]
MPVPVTAYRVLIGSPSDVSAERKVIEAAIHTWNSMNSIRTETILLPVMWELDSAPLQGDRPQGILNNLIVKECDIIVSLFWSRLGSDTGVEKSGTVEEIKYFIKEKRPTLIYFSKRPLPQEHDTDQWSRLCEFKKEIRGGGVQEDFDGESDLSMKLIRHLTIVMGNINTAPTVATKEVNRLIREEDVVLRKAKKQKGPTITEKNSSYALRKCTEKSFYVDGLHDKSYKWPASLYGQFVTVASVGRVWQFSNKRKEAVAKLLGIDAHIAD